MLNAGIRRCWPYLWVTTLCSSGQCQGDKWKWIKSTHISAGKGHLQLKWHRCSCSQREWQYFLSKAPQLTFITLEGDLLQCSSTYRPLDVMCKFIKAFRNSLHKLGTARGMQHFLMNKEIAFRSPHSDLIKRPRHLASTNNSVFNF